jgi:hypothetical protein
MRMLGINRGLHAVQHGFRQDRPDRLTGTWTSLTWHTPRQRRADSVVSHTAQPLTKSRVDAEFRNYHRCSYSMFAKEQKKFCIWT